MNILGLAELKSLVGQERMRVVGFCMYCRVEPRLCFHPSPNTVSQHYRNGKMRVASGTWGGGIRSPRWPRVVPRWTEWDWIASSFQSFFSPVLMGPGVAGRWLHSQRTAWRTLRTSSSELPLGRGQLLPQACGIIVWIIHLLGPEMPCWRNFINTKLCGYNLNYILFLVC